MANTLREDLLKGLFLGLWAYLALVQNPAAPDWERFGTAVGIVAAGLLIGTIIGAIVQLRRGYRPGRNLAAFPLIVLLESPFWIPFGILAGLGVAVTTLYQSPAELPWLIAGCAGAGLVLGYGFTQLRQINDWITRFGLALIVGALLTFIAIYYLDELPGFEGTTGHRVLGIVLLAGIPFFYLLSFCGEEEESEVEIAALCASLGLGLYYLFAGSASIFGDKFILLIPLMLYFVYVTRWLPILRVVKHVLRGYTALNLNQPIEALRRFRRALALAPRDELARGGLWALHQKIDVDALPEQSPLLAHLDYEFCLDQVHQAIVSRVPSALELERGRKMLAFVGRHKPELLARVDYLKAVSLTHSKQFEEAAEQLRGLLDPEKIYDAPRRRRVLLAAWDLALRLHPELVKRLGDAELALPGRRMEAIAAVERALAANANDDVATVLKPVLYAGLQESEFLADAASGLPEHFNYDYAEQLGLALIEQPAQRERGMGYLRIAGRGLADRAPGIFTKLADLADEVSDSEAARGYREQVKRAGQLVGVKTLNAEAQILYFNAVKRLSDDAEHAGDHENAIANLRLYLENGTGELEGYRKLAGLYEQGRDPLNALLMVETGLLYKEKDADLLARKDKYYYSVEVERLAQVKEKVERFFDVDYCISKANSVLNSANAEVEALDWAEHLCKLAAVIKPDSVNVKLTAARVLLRKGSRTPALAILEDIREAKPSGGEEKEAWFAASKMLGDLYLNELERPDLAVKCYMDYRDCNKSGADTLFYIAKSHEAMNDAKNAIRFYEAVTAYDQHPKYWEAREAITRLKN